jgi:hypothetical protein
VRTLGSRLSEALAVLPAGTAAGSAAAGTRDPVRAPAVSAAVLRAGATDRHAWLDAIRADLGSALPVGGAIRHEVIDRVVAEAGGPLRAETLTRASLRAVAEHDGRTASVRRLNRDTAAIDVADIPDRLRADPAPSHLPMAPGGASEDDLIAACGAGLLISRLDYLRVLHPRDTLVTGTTRDATGWIRDGRVVAWHPQVRLTFRMDDVLRAVLAAGRERERGETPFMESVTAPALLIDQGPIRL